MAVGAAGFGNEGEAVKSQTVRLLDMPLGALMIWGGVQATRSNQVLGVILAASGVLTIVYNAKNYLDYEKGKR